MKISRLFSSSLILSSMALCFSAPLQSADAARKPVVVELFTSEGCSSCPPADKLLAQLQEQQPVAGAEILAVEEHVDYWNHQGWVDPFSAPEWTQRQQDYVRLTKQDEYTPEFVVDGRSQFDASNPQRAEAEIEKASQGVKTEVSISSDSESKGNARFKITVGKLAGNSPNDVAEIWVAVTEDGLQSKVGAGENAGHMLPHVATLRWLHKIGVADANTASGFSGDAQVKLNSHWNADHVRVIVFVQEKKSRQILGAAALKIKA